jgi:hypothetical protein
MKGKLRGHKESITALTYHPNGYLLGASILPKASINEIHGWETNGMHDKLLIQYTSRTGGFCDRLAVSPDGTILVAGDNGTDILIWDWKRIFPDG